MLGVLSLVFWALILVICVKYLVFVLRADNRGEGGILALMTLVTDPKPRSFRLREGSILLMLGLFAAANVVPMLFFWAQVEGWAQSSLLLSSGR